ncbi:MULTISPECIES: response regulator transcription factor [Mycolicibacterium]|jgi:DNA-binding NarL/FixJ family response regulator|uniref:Two component transcriptional regulator, LuxR family n=1 Tax=Mycolicibacterium vanbaalenii (strain DSM 7251 / JCM 13017 / BCRC 16820 / KCTC 9966 / NRRL B-24157 / PYR-1) TaxID=350058 RepID=A1T597_MYCVP|nr:MULTISPECIES: response regulator transcription factor [Mycolicibacterium]ABM12347.1 two component transcriptional regulator, LuxR family [Mycolicibacterium vanbaalenii PYR-1]MCV7127726.1 response regulator transcription factor [Mycolicibacterium vanbaalenii PYR-1]MDW5610924.1 response regulator transcription factor [Mycolicibacterium sp. D5.8-2]PQP45111.1 DNA-binding response regulator [Mycolicibacterium austroafricanum]
MSRKDGARRAVRIAIIDDHDVVHAGIRAWCEEADPPIELVGSFLRPSEYFSKYPTATDQVDVVLFDVQIEGNRPDFDTLSKLAERDQPVVVYSHITTDEVILTSLDLGAITYLVKSEGRRHLIEAIHAAHTDTPYVGPRMGNAMLNDSTVGRIKLTDREKQVLVAWFQTESKDLVAKRLFIAPSTVRTHLQRARAKYAGVGRPAPTKSALLARAIEDGILSLNDLY